MKLLFQVVIALPRLFRCFRPHFIQLLQELLSCHARIHEVLLRSRSQVIGDDTRREVVQRP